MAIKSITIKRATVNSGTASWDSLMPVTEGQNVYGKSSGNNANTPLLDSNDKLARAYLQLYEHNITITYSTTVFVTFKLINTTSSEYTTSNRDLTVALYNAGFTRTGTSSSYTYVTTEASGVYYNSGFVAIINGVFATSNNSNSSTLGIRASSIIDYSSSTATIRTTGVWKTYDFTVTSNCTLKDYVRTL